MTTLPGVEMLVDLLGRDVVNFGLGVNAVGDDARLRAGHGNGRHAERVQRDGGERDGLLFAGGQEHVHLAFARQRRDVLRELDQAVRHAAHRGDDDDDLVALRVIFGHARGDVLDAVGVAHRSAAVFLNNQCHTKICLRQRNARAGED